MGWLFGLLLATTTAIPLADRQGLVDQSGYICATEEELTFTSSSPTLQLGSFVCITPTPEITSTVPTPQLTQSITIAPTSTPTPLPPPASPTPDPLIPTATPIVLVPTPTPNIGTEVPFRVESYATNLVVPWSIVFTDSTRMLVSERPGRIKAITNNGNSVNTVFTFSPVSASAEEGLMGLALDPSYATNRLLYACIAYPKGGNLVNRIVQLRDNQASLSEMRTIIDDLPSARFHAGCRLGFGPSDGKLYVTLGDVGDEGLAQNTNSLAGKILRMNSDGSVPTDNPRPGSLVYSIGHRNPQGLDWHPVTGQLYSTEHGPSANQVQGPGGDEINRIVPNGNYGWPTVSHDESQAGLISPLSTFFNVRTSVAPGSGTFYSGTVFPQFTNNYFIGTLVGESLVRVKFSDINPDQIEILERIPTSIGRIREVAEGPDGYIYFATSNQDGRGSPRSGDDQIFRIVPQ